LLIFVLTFLLFEWLLSENAVVGNLVGWFWSIPRQNSSSVPRGMYSALEYRHKLTCCVGTTKVKIMVCNYSTPEKNPPRPLECSPASRRPVTLVTFALLAAAAFGGKNYNVNNLTI